MKFTIRKFCWNEPLTELTGCSGDEEEVTVPDGVNVIGFRAFEKCKRLRRIVLPGSVRGILSGAFRGFRTLEEVVFSEGLEEIGQDAFEMTGLKSVILPDSLRRIGFHAFYGCKSLRTVRLPDGDFAADSTAFYDTPWLKEMRVKDWLIVGGTLLSCDPGTPHITVPEGVTAISGDAFPDYVCSVTVPEGVTRLENSAFESLPLLERVQLPESLTRIGMECFRNCEVLEEVNIPERVEAIGEYAFDRTPFRKHHIIGEDVIVGDRLLAYLGRDLFYDVLPRIRVIDSYAFAHGLRTRHILVPDSVRRIAEAAFWGNKRIERIDLPETMESIGTDAFSDCVRLRTIRFPKGVHRIGSNVFAYCRSLEELRIPEDVEVIEDGAFYGSGLRSITLPEGLRVIEASAFESCFQLRDVMLPESIEAIGNKAFPHHTTLHFAYGGHLVHLKLLHDWRSDEGRRFLDFLRAPDPLHFAPMCSDMKLALAPEFYDLSPEIRRYAEDHAPTITAAYIYAHDAGGLDRFLQARLLRTPLVDRMIGWLIESFDPGENAEMLAMLLRYKKTVSGYRGDDLKL